MKKYPPVRSPMEPEYSEEERMNLSKGVEIYDSLFVSNSPIPYTFWIQICSDLQERKVP